MGDSVTFEITFCVATSALLAAAGSPAKAEEHARDTIRDRFRRLFRRSSRPEIRLGGCFSCHLCLAMASLDVDTPRVCLRNPLADREFGPSPRVLLAAARSPANPSCGTVTRLFEPAL